MNYKLKLIKPILIVLILLLLCSACNKNKETTNSNENHKLIAVTINPLKLIIQEIVGNEFEIVTILPYAASPHTFEPKPSDALKIQNAELVFFVSNSLDGWIANLANKKNKIKLMQYVAQNIATSKIFFDSEIHNHRHCEHSCEHTHNANIVSDNSEDKLDPHFWVSPALVKSIAQEICDKIIEIDKQNAAKYQNNAENFIKKLDELHNQLSNQVKPIHNKPIFTFHNSFNYFIKEFDLTFGGSIEEFPGKEASPKYLANLTAQIRKANVNAIFSEPQLNPKAINVIAKEVNIRVVELDPIGGKNQNETYFSFIKENANQLISALK